MERERKQQMNICFQETQLTKNNKLSFNMKMVKTNKLSEMQNSTLLLQKSHQIQFINHKHWILLKRKNTASAITNMIMIISMIITITIMIINKTMIIATIIIMITSMSTIFITTMTTITIIKKRKNMRIRMMTITIIITV